VTNPYEAAFDGVAVLGHSGQPVSDIARQRMDCLPSAKPATVEYEGEAEEKEAIASKIGERTTYDCVAAFWRTCGHFPRCH
jgi:hypothetical protein